MLIAVKFDLVKMILKEIYSTEGLKIVATFNTYSNFILNLRTSKIYLISAVLIPG